MAFLGDLGSALNLGDTSKVFDWAVRTGASYYSGGIIPPGGSPFEEKRNPEMFQQDPGLTAELSRMQSQNGMGARDTGFFGNLGTNIATFGQGIGSFLNDISPLTSLFGGGRSISRSNTNGAQTIITQRPDETSQSGELLGANLGLGLNLLNQGTRFLRSPSGQIGTGVGVGALTSFFGDSCARTPRITRRMKSDVRRIYMMAGMDPNVTAQILNNMGTYPKINFDASTVYFILTKRFRNDGPVVTKAAVRKTKTTLRRMKGVVDMYNSVCKTPTRRAPARRAAPKAVQLIKN